MGEGLRPICFMVMPFGTKPTGVADGKSPAEADFDQVWEKVLRPAITELNYEAVRADEDLGALIIADMLERLTLADLVVADMTLSNGNVYYEVGIRHGAKEAGCVLVSAGMVRSSCSMWRRCGRSATRCRRRKSPRPTPRPPSSC
ncbi:MAG: hypothetical protein HC869_06605 [Rhodospirillales bacterium]|nr:hypothetical protein [Rhodospirillales bacterium]